MNFFNEGKKKEKGMSVFLDVFRRADKNDDDCLSWHEFRSFFADGVLSEEELRNLFHEIDTHDTNNIDTGELCEYFSKHLGSFKDIFGAVEDLNHFITKALVASDKEYQNASFMDQFVTRFLLREILNQLAALGKPLDAASASLEQSALAEREGRCAATVIEASLGHHPVTVDSDTIDAVVAASITPGRVGRRTRRQLSTQTSWNMEAGAGAGPLAQQVDRLRSLLDRMENRVNFDGITGEEVDIEKDKMMLIVQRKFVVISDRLKTFRSSVRSYVESVEDDPGCLHVSVRSYAGSNCFIMYEIWDCDEQWKMFLKSKECRSFQHSNIDNLETPEVVSSLRVPSSWWIRE